MIRTIFLNKVGFVTSYWKRIEENLAGVDKGSVLWRGSGRYVFGFLAFQFLSYVKELCCCYISCHTHDDKGI